MSILILAQHLPIALTAAKGAMRQCNKRMTNAMIMGRHQQSIGLTSWQIIKSLGVI